MLHSLPVRRATRFAIRLHPEIGKKLGNMLKTCRSPDRQRMEHRQVVFAAAPIFRRLESPSLRGLVLTLLRSIACIRRYSEKMLRGYYWEEVCLNSSKFD